MEASFQPGADKVLFNHRSYSSDFLRRLCQFREDGLFTDVTIEIGESTFQAHKLVLASFSTYFRNIFENETAENMRIQIDNVKAGILRSLLEYAYSGVIELSADNVQELMVVTKQLGIHELQKTCEEFAARFVNFNNCTDVLKFARNKGFEVLEEKTLDVFSQNNTEMIKNLDLSPEQLLDMFNVDFDLLSNGLPLSVEEREILLLEKLVKSVIKNVHLGPDLADFLQNMHLPSINKGKAIEIIQKIPKIDENEVVYHLIDLAFMYSSGRDVPEVPPYWTGKPHQGEWKLTTTELYSNKVYIEDAVDFFDTSSVRPNNSIRQITVYLRHWVDIYVIGGMTVVYNDGQTFSFGLQYNSPFVTKRCDIKLGEREWIIKVKVNSGYVVDNLMFTTNKGRTFGPISPTGKGYQGESEVKAGVYNHLHSFYGYVSDQYGCVVIRQIGFTWAEYKRSS